MKVEGEITHKTTFNTSSDTMSYDCLPSSLLYESITLNWPIHTTLDESVNLHAYLNDIIISVKGMIAT